ncbi:MULTISPECIES: (d)CMP kinase [Aeromonas]|uniref:(d)CMP kinase n=1 Tax=Aeromonas TaxID=642 RepID=UPI002443882A|nr:(d)CMP kinase [Aeromonas dhakensis]
MKRINVVGTSGSGKSTFSQVLANKLNYPYLEMDAMFWKPNWQGSTDEELFATLKRKLADEYWVLDGNYNRTVPIKWERVDTVIWIDYSFSRTLYQAIKRAFLRSLTKQELWKNSGNVESFRKSFLSKDSVILWACKTYKNNRARYLQIFSDPKYSHIRFIRLQSPTMVKAFICGLSDRPPIKGPRSDQ